jgi:putative intracellular protease/amidase
MIDLLIVMSSHDRLGDTGYMTGSWFDQLAAPYYLFRSAGAEVILASPLGGHPPIDPRSDFPPHLTPAVDRFRCDDEARAALADTLRLDQVDPAEFDGVFYPGGYGVLWDLAEDAVSRALLEWRGRHHRPVALVDHAPAALRHAVDADGVSLLYERRVTCISTSEEAAGGFSAALPFALQQELLRLGASYSQGPDGAPHVVRDGFLITGQNAASAMPVARALLEIVTSPSDL